MYKQQIKKNKGFTIIEAMVAIFILTVSVSSMLGITASSTVSARYANNETTVNYLLQEAIDSIRNSRDTIAFQQKDSIDGWDKFLSRYGSPSNKCFSPVGCYLKMDNFDPEGLNNLDIEKCDNEKGCPYLKYDNEASHIFYNYTDGVESEFKRTINMKKINNNNDEVKVTVTLEWFNGGATMSRTQTLTVYLLNWQK